VFVLRRIKLPFYPLAMTQFFEEVRGRHSEMHEITETASVALSIFILPAASFSKICDGRELGI
jgi:hypothetical protein